MAFLFPYTIITQGLYSSLVSAISAITFGTCKLVKSVYMHKNPDIEKIIRELDVERRLKLVNSIINTINTSSIHDEAKIKLNDLEKTQVFELVGAETDLKNDPIELCMKYLHEVIQDINNCLIAIDNKVSRYNTKWFKFLRKLDIKFLLSELEILSKLLDKRYNDLLQVSMFLAHKK